MEDDRWKLLQELGRMMSDISEACYCAGWMGNTEYIVPELCTRAVKSGVAQPWGQSQVTPAKAAELCAAAALLGHWADLDEMAVHYEPFQPFPVPAEIIDEIERERREAAKRRR